MKCKYSKDCELYDEVSCECNLYDGEHCGFKKEKSSKCLNSSKTLNIQ